MEHIQNLVVKQPKINFFFIDISFDINKQTSCKHDSIVSTV
jgi:hypothetical protein